MKKAILLFVTLSVIALAAVFAFTHTYFTQGKLLRENAAALAQVVADCPDGKYLCARITSGNTVHLFYWNVAPPPEET